MRFKITSTNIYCDNCWTTTRIVFANPDHFYQRSANKNLKFCLKNSNPHSSRLSSPVEKHSYAAALGLWSFGRDICMTLTVMQWNNGYLFPCNTMKNVNIIFDPHFMKAYKKCIWKICIHVKHIYFNIKSL